mgnify:CR=1 FL=1
MRAEIKRQLNGLLEYLEWNYCGEVSNSEKIDIFLARATKIDVAPQIKALEEIVDFLESNYGRPCNEDINDYWIKILSTTKKQLEELKNINDDNSNSI